MPRKTDHLRRVKRASEKRRQAEQEYRTAVVNAREAGYTYHEIGQAAGITEQAAAQLYKRVR